MSTNHHTAITTGAAANAATVNSPLGELDAAILGDVGARVYNSADISIPNTTTTTLTFDSERYDTASLHSTVSNTSRLTAPVAGKYLIHGQVRFNNSSAGYRQLYLLLNGTTSIERAFGDANASGYWNFSISTIYRLAANDYVEFQVYQNSGGALDVQSQGNHSPEFMMQLIGRE